MWAEKLIQFIIGTIVALFSSAVNCYTLQTPDLLTTLGMCNGLLIFVWQIEYFDQSKTTILYKLSVPQF